MDRDAAGEDPSTFFRVFRFCLFLRMSFLLSQVSIISYQMHKPLKLSQCFMIILVNPSESYPFCWMASDTESISGFQT